MQNKTKKFISALLIISMIVPVVLFSQPKKAEAIPVIAAISDFLKGIGNLLLGSSSVSNATTASTAVKTWYEKIFSEVLKAIAKRALQEMTKSTVNWINSGFHGSPLFLENPQSFFKDVAKSEIKDIVDTFGYDNIRFPFGKDFALNTINSYKSTLANNASYTLSTVMNDKAQLYNYQNNFNVGGWNGFLINTQYPQNNYLGFQMMATEELANRLQGTSQTAAQKVQTALQQGQGFLSPQKCDPAVNPLYNNMQNEFQKPSFNDAEYNKTHPIPGDNATKEEVEKWTNEYNVAILEWNTKNRCIRKDGTSGLINTTPGSVVSNQIMNAMVSPQKQGELSAAMGNSLSAIFDALLNHFIDKGLNSLASKANPPPQDDNWSYNGQTLGVAGDSGSDWSTSPDQEISLNEFRKQISGKTISKDVNGAIKEEIGKTNNGEFMPGDIANTETEIVFLNLIPQLMSNTLNLNNPPGVIQLTQTLDRCLPGPDKGWVERLKSEQERITKLFISSSGDDSNLKLKAATDATRELKFAVDSFKDWITTKMLSSYLSLPGGVVYMDAVNDIDNFSQKSKESTDTRRAKSTTLARLQSINKALENLATTLKNKVPSLDEPEKGSAEEKTLIILKQQYNSIQSSISSSITLENTKSELDTLNDKIKNLQKLNTQCEKERAEKGWEPVEKTIDANGNAKGNSILTTAAGKEITRSKMYTEQDGDLRIIAGIVLGPLFWSTGKVGDQIVTSTTKTTGSEIEQFCQLPISSGYSHGEVIRPDSSNNQGAQLFTFRNLDVVSGDITPAPGYQDLPMVNASDVYGDIVCTGVCSWFSGHGGFLLGGGEQDKRISVKIDCNTLFKANIIDYTHAGDPNF